VTRKDLTIFTIVTYHQPMESDPIDSNVNPPLIDQSMKSEPIDFSACECVLRGLEYDALVRRITLR
jgi:hypothetical protein